MGVCGGVGSSMQISRMQISRVCQRCGLEGVQVLGNVGLEGVHVCKSWGV